MITEQDLQEAIAECQGVRNPSANTCLKLAAYYTIQDRLFPVDKPETNSRQLYSYSPPPEPQVEYVTYSSDTAFGQAVRGRDVNSVLKTVDEMMSVLELTQPRLYNGVMRKISLDEF